MMVVPLAYNNVEPVSLTHRFEPTLSVFVGFTFAIPTFVVVTRDANAFESFMRISLLLPCTMVVSSVCEPVTEVVVMPNIFPSALTRITGTCEELP
jgi:hypothetical protein